MKSYALILLIAGLVAPPVGALELQWAGEFQVGEAPHQIAFADDGQRAFIAAAGSARIGIVDTASLRVLPAVAFEGVPLGVAPLAADRLLVSRFDGRSVSEVALPGGARVATIEVGGAPSLWTALPGGRFLIASEKADRVTLVAADPLREVARLATGRRPFPVTYSESRHTVYVPEYDDGTVGVIDLAAGRTVARLAAGERPSGASVFDDDRKLAVAVRGENKIALFDLDTLQPLGAIVAGIGDGPFSLVATPDRRWLFVNNTRSHDVSVIDAKTLRVVKRQPVCEIPIVLAIEQSRSRLWVACEGEMDHRVQVFDIGDETGSDDPESVIQRRAVAEVRQLHRFFARWMRGELPADDATFARFTAVLAADMSFISPAGREIPRPDLIAAVRDSHGTAQDDPGARIWTSDERIETLAAGLYLVTYREHQDIAGQYRVRQSSAVLRRNDALPDGFEWRHVHETWSEPAAEQAKGPVSNP